MPIIANAFLTFLGSTLCIYSLLSLRYVVLLQHSSRNFVILTPFSSSCTYGVLASAIPQTEWFKF